MKELELYQIRVPLATDSYAPVSHRNMIEAVKEQLDIHNLIVSNSYYNTARDGQQLIGYMDIKRSDNEELGLRLAFRNSYDKSMSVAFLAGCSVFICSNGMLSGEMKYVRKHTGTVIQEMNEKITHSINELDAHFERMVKHSDRMKEIEIEPRVSAELAGRLFIEHNLVSSQQMNIIKREIAKPSYVEFVVPSLWSFYNHVTNSLREAHPLNYISQHVNFHNFIETEFELV
jgi:hypothetical protein